VYVPLSLVMEKTEGVKWLQSVDKHAMCHVSTSLGVVIQAVGITPQQGITVDFLETQCHGVHVRILGLDIRTR